jgi:hypothetical protein
LSPRQIPSTPESRLDALELRLQEEFVTRKAMKKYLSEDFVVHRTQISGAPGNAMSDRGGSGDMVLGDIGNLTTDYSTDLSITQNLTELQLGDTVNNFDQRRTETTNINEGDTLNFNDVSEAAKTVLKKWVLTKINKIFRWASFGLPTGVDGVNEFSGVARLRVIVFTVGGVVTDGQFVGRFQVPDNVTFEVTGTSFTYSGDAPALTLWHTKGGVDFETSDGTVVLGGEYLYPTVAVTAPDEPVNLTYQVFGLIQRRYHAPPP